MTFQEFLEKNKVELVENYVSRFAFSIIGKLEDSFTAGEDAHFSVIMFLEFAETEWIRSQLRLKEEKNGTNR